MDQLEALDENKHWFMILIALTLGVALIFWILQKVGE